MTNEELATTINSTYLLMVASSRDAKEGQMPYGPWAALKAHFYQLLAEQSHRAVVGNEALR